MKQFARPMSILCCLVLAANGGWAIYNYKHRSTAPAFSNSRVNYPYLSGRIFSEDPNDVLINFVPLRKSLENTFAQISVQKSFYFEYLPTGTSIRIGSDNELIAASLIKVPLVMNLYKAAELNRINLDQQVRVTEAEIDKSYGDLWQKGTGFTMTIRQAAQYALEQSDNTATHVIFDHVRGLLKEDEESMSQLDIDQNLENGQAVINSKSYASILKSLYFSSYLQKQNSEEILNYLAHSTEVNRLTKHIPSHVPVAHKNGVFNVSWSESDCGIVYVPKRPYILCVMVGLPEDQANAFIADVSRQVYDFVSSEK